VIACSLIGAAAIFLLGGLANAIGGFGFDVSNPYNDPTRVWLTAAGAVPGLVVAQIGIGYALYDAARRGLTSWFGGMLAWQFVPALVSILMFATVLGYPGAWFIPLAFVPLASLIYALAAPPVVSAPSGGKPTTSSSSRLAVFFAVLAVVVLAACVVLYPRPQGTTVPAGPPQLQVTQSSASANCTTGSFPPVTLTNSSNTTLQWTANSQDPNVMASPSSGSLAPGGSITVSLSGTTSATSVIVEFAAGGQTVPAKFGCQAGTSK
jgi:hypothetical protein